MNEETRELTLLEALERYSDPDAWRTYREFEPFYSRLYVFFLGAPPSATELREQRATELRGQLESKLLSSLQTGDLVAYAHVAPLRAEAEPVKISAQKWKLLKVDFDVSVAKS
jgi:hypothetical protein